MILLSCIPLVTFLALLYRTQGFNSGAHRCGGARENFLVACVLWGALVVLITETLGLFSAITVTSVALAWGLVAVSCIVLSHRHPRSPRLSILDTDGLSIVMVGVVVVVGLVAIIALRAPPHTYDALEYHMSRVVHWVENRSVSHYPTHISRQLYMPPWTEFAILQFQVLTAGDRLANLVQWFSMVAAAVAVSLIVKELGGGRSAQALGAAVAVSIPMGVLQASSAKTDYAVAFWSIAFVYWSIRSRSIRSRSIRSRSIRSRSTRPGARLMAATCLGLALLSKPTAYLFLAPFIAWHVAAMLRDGVGPAVRSLLVLALVPASLNLGHYSRNLSTFGNALGPPGEYSGPAIRFSDGIGTVVGVRDPRGTPTHEW